jgi:hypothetical protein
MAQQNILPGRAPIVWSTVDEAFQQINANFTELYLSIGGTGVDLSNIAASLIPDSNSVRDLGSAARRWKDIYLSGSSIYLGPAVITANLSGHVNLPSGSTVGGALIRNPDESSFKTVRVSGQDDVVANNFEGILNLTGNGISIATNADSDTVTLTNSGVTSISQGSGVSISNSTGAVTISNTGVITATSAGSGIAIGGTSSNITISNTGVTQLTAGTGIVLSDTVGSITVTNSQPNITQNVYRFVAVTGSPTLDPSGPTSTLNITTSGDGLSITANTISNTVTFSNTGVTSINLDDTFNITNSTGVVNLGLKSTIQRNLDGDVTGSVFADDSTILVDSTNGVIVGNVVRNEFTVTTGIQEHTWTFGSNGSLTFPDDEVQTTAYAGGVGHMMMIDTNRTDTYTEIGTADKPFKTFAAAIAAAEANPATAFTFVMMGCTVTEDVDFTGTTFTQITISTACRSVITGNVTIAGISTLSQLFVRNIEIGGTFTLTGDGTDEQMNSCNFYDVTFSGPVNITATNATAFFEASFFDTVDFTNLSYLYINGGQFNDDWTITADDTGVIPSRGINPGTGGSIAIVFGTIANNVYFVKGGTGAYVFQPHMTRLGRTTESYTIPVGWIVSAYGADFRGTWTNNGSMGMKISGTDNRVLGTAPSYSSIVGGDRVIADLAPANSTGVEGDRAGMIAVGGGYIYICTADWVSPGSADIWTRTALTAGAW